MFRHRQLHLWITEHDHSMLRDLAVGRKETLSAVIRRLIKMHHAQAEDGSATERPSPVDELDAARVA
jgi:hypothetical protein